MPRGPVDRLLERLRYFADVCTSQMRGDNPVTVTMDEPNGNLQSHQARECLPTHGPRQRVATNDDEVDARVAHFSEYGLERERVAVDVVERSDLHRTSGSVVLSRKITPEQSPIAD